MPYKDPAKRREFSRTWAADRKLRFLEEIGCQECRSTKDLTIKSAIPGNPIRDLKPWLHPVPPSAYRVLCADCVKKERAERARERQRNAKPRVRRKTAAAKVTPPKPVAPEWKLPKPTKAAVRRAEELGAELMEAAYASQVSPEAIFWSRNKKRGTPHANG